MITIVQSMVSVVWRTDTRWRCFICRNSERAVRALDTELSRISMRRRSLMVHLVAPLAHPSFPPSIRFLIWPSAAFSFHPCTIFLLLPALSGQQNHKLQLQIYVPLPLPAAWQNLAVLKCITQLPHSPSWSDLDSKRKGWISACKHTVPMTCYSRANVRRLGHLTTFACVQLLKLGFYICATISLFTFHKLLIK